MRHKTKDKHKKSTLYFTLTPRAVRIKARLQPFTVLSSFSAILVCFIDAQIHSCFREKMSEFERQ